MIQRSLLLLLIDLSLGAAVDDTIDLVLLLYFLG